MIPSELLFRRRAPIFYEAYLRLRAYYLKQLASPISTDYAIAIRAVEFSLNELSFEELIAADKSFFPEFYI